MQAAVRTPDDRLAIRVPAIGGRGGGDIRMRAAEQGLISLSARPPAALVGRAAESAAIQRMMGRAQLVTVTGPPGAGKTAVAVAAAAAMGAQFADGAWLVTLDSLQDEDLLPHAIADALNVPDRLSSSRMDALAEELRHRRLLLVLDNCEHLVTACENLAMALQMQPCPGVRIVATSREPLRVPGVLTVTIGPLQLGDAVTMFDQRAREAAPGFVITPANRETVEAICSRLDRMPLAIDLAARQLAFGSVDQLRSRLEADYWFLRNSEDSPPRHETLLAAIGWSHELCTPVERLLWARLSVFTGSFRLEDAQEVCAGSHLSDQGAAAAVAMLAAQSILLMEFQPDGQARFRLPPTIRAYGTAMLRRLGEEAEWQRRYQAWREAHRSGSGMTGEKY
jgi:predicted ATPase